MKFALGQIEVVAGRPDLNVEAMLSMIHEAKIKGVDLIAFPEMCIGGYLLGDKWTESNFCEDLISHEEKIIEASDGIAVAFGNIYLGNSGGFHPNKDGRSRKYNAVKVYQNKKPVERLNPVVILPNGVQPKTLLPNYRIFDDERYFFSLQDVSKDFGIPLEELIQPFLIEVNGERVPVGFEVCEDLWCDDYRRNGRSLNVTEILIKNGARFVVNISASPWTYGKNRARDNQIKSLERGNENHVPFFYVNCTGVQNNGKNIITFDGGSTVYNSWGDPIIFSRAAYESELIVFDEEDLKKKGILREESSKIEQKYKTIIRGIKHLRDLSFSSSQLKFVIGLSGGVDSAVNAALLTLAVGAENVLGVNLPTKYNSDKTKDAAKSIAEKLKIKYSTLPIGELVGVNKNLIDGCDLDLSGKKLSEFNMENVQAKIRGTSIISNLAAKYNAYFTNNGNKVEVALGYATLYGDWGGAIAPIADLTKTEVIEMGKYINEKIFGEEIIPNSLFPNDLWEFGEDKIAPTAELKEAQIDPMKFGYHCALLEAMTDFKKKSAEEIMKWYLEGTLCRNLKIKPELVRRWGIDRPGEFIRDIEWFYSKVQSNVFKRVQAPPIILTSKTAYGYDLRESMLPFAPTKKFLELKRKILEMEAYVENEIY